MTPMDPNWLDIPGGKTFWKNFSDQNYHANSPPFSNRPTQYNIYNSTERVVVPEDNHLILFFSQLRHKIMPNLSHRDRFSLSFNLLPKGKFGTGDSKVIF